MTEKLYYKDAYIKEFSASVTESVKTDKGYLTVLDKTAFFPEEGGQYSDTGSLNGIPVRHVYEKDGVIYHLTDGALRVGEDVVGKINFEERFEKMQSHTAEHILSGLFFKHHGLSNVGFHLGNVDVTMDISAPLSRLELDEIERRANEIIFENVPVRAVFPSGEELASMNYRAKLDLKENVRIVLIGDYDACACCAPHVSYTGEIGLVKILDTEKLRGGMRLHIAAGRRAVSVFSSLYKTALKISDLISMPKPELFEGVDALLTSFNRVKSEYQSFRLRSYIEKAKKADVPDSKNAVLYFDGATPTELREIANAIADRGGEYLVLLSGEDSLQYVIVTKTVDVKDVIGNINSELSGRGGGRGNMASGSFGVNIERVREYFK